MLDLLPSASTLILALASVTGFEVVRRYVGRLWIKRIEPDLDRRDEQRRREQANDDTLRQIAQEFTSNGGASLHDRVVQLEDGQERIEERLNEASTQATTNGAHLESLHERVDQILDAVTRPEEP